MTKRDAAVDEEPNPRARLADRRVVAIQVGQFALAGVIALTIVGLATAVASRRIGEREAITDARSSTVIQAQGLVQPVLTDDLVTGSKTAIARIDRVVRRDVLDASLVRVKIWDRNGKILYSDEPRLIGEPYELGADERASIDSGAIEAGVSDLAKPENRYERASGKLLEVYLPIRTPSGTTLLFEAYYRYSLVEHIGSRLWRSFAPISLGALLDAGARSDPDRVVARAPPPPPAPGARAPAPPRTRGERRRAAPDRERPSRRRGARPRRRRLRAFRRPHAREQARGSDADADAHRGLGRVDPRKHPRRCAP